MSYQHKPSSLRASRVEKVTPAIGGQSEVARIILRELAGDEQKVGFSGSDVIRSVPPEREHLIIAAKRLLKLRKLRGSYLPTKQLGEPAWDLLLMIYAYEHATRELRIADLAQGAGVAKTTALRTLQRLTKDGLIDCKPNPLDKRAAVHRLTEGCRRGLDRYFEAVEIAFSEELV